MAGSLEVILWRVLEGEVSEHSQFCIARVKSHYKYLD